MLQNSGCLLCHMAACSLSICVQKKDVNLCSKEGAFCLAGQGEIGVFKFCSPKLHSSGCRLRQTTACSLCSKE